VKANQTADGGEGYFLSNYGECLSWLALTYEADITWYIYPRRANMAAGGDDQPPTNRCPAVVSLDMFLILFPEVAKSSENRVRCCLS